MNVKEKLADNLGEVLAFSELALAIEGYNKFTSAGGEPRMKLDLGVGVGMFMPWELAPQSRDFWVGVTGSAGASFCYGW